MVMFMLSEENEFLNSLFFYERTVTLLCEIQISHSLLIREYNLLNNTF